MNPLLGPWFAKSLKIATVWSSVWLLLLTAGSSVAHFFTGKPDPVYLLLWHGHPAHAAWCVPALSIALPASISLLAMLGLLAAYRGRLLGIADERVKLNQSLSPGPLFDAALASKVGHGAPFKAAYVILLVCAAWPWLLTTKTLIEMASVFGLFVIVCGSVAACIFRGWISSVNPVPRIKHWLAALAKRRLGDQFDLLPSNEKEWFRKHATQAGLDITDEKFQLAAVQDYNARVKRAYREANDLSSSSPGVSLSPQKTRL